MILLLTDNSTAKIRSLARVFAHLLMFSDVGINAQHIAGEVNVIADYLACAKNTNDFPSFSFKKFQTEFPWHTGSRRFLPSRELSCLLTTALSKQSVDIPTTRVPLGQLQDGPAILR
jgi:hypothetical protein